MNCLLFLSSGECAALCLPKKQVNGNLSSFQFFAIIMDKDSVNMYSFMWAYIFLIRYDFITNILFYPFFLCKFIVLIHYMVSWLYVCEARREISLSFQPCHGACGILVSQPGIKPAPSAVEAQSLNH